MSMIGC